MSEEQQVSIPPPPAGMNDPDQIAGAEERWATCPLHDCKHNPELLYSDFYTRDIRTNRLICNACAVRVEMGYMAREVAKAAEDRFYTGDIASDMVLCAVMGGGAIVGNMAAIVINNPYYGFFIGGAVGAVIAVWARRLAGKKVTRQSHYFGTAGIIIGAILALLMFKSYYIDSFSIFAVIACTVGMTMASWGIFLRRI